MTIKTVTNADTGTADIVGGDDWDSVATIINDQQGPASTIIYKAGSTIKAYDVNNQALITSGTTADIIIQAAIDALGNTSGKKIVIKSGFYQPTAALNFTNIDGYCTIEGEGPLGITQIRPTGDFSAFTITGSKTRINLKNLYFTHNQSGYTSNMVEFKNGAANNRVQDCAFYDFATKKGNAIGLVCTSANVYSNYIYDCLVQGFDNVVFGNATNSSFFCNGNVFRGGKFQDFKRILTVTSSASCAFDNNNFYNIDVQCYSGTLAGFDYNTTHSGHSFFTVHESVNLVDLPAAKNYAELNGTTELLTIGCYPAWLIGGTTTKHRRFDYYTRSSGAATFSGDGTTKTFVVTHAMNGSQAPTQIVIYPISADAIGSCYVDISTVTTTQFTITYLVPPPSGTNNLKISWRAEY